jgi:hypothetical protein
MNYIHHNTDTTHYSLTENELNELSDKSQPLWKDVCLTSLALGVPTLFNGIQQTISQEIFKLNLSIFLNYLLGIISICLSVIFGIAWARNYKSKNTLIAKIKSKPKIEFHPTTSDVGRLDELEKKIEEVKNQPAKSD